VSVTNPRLEAPRPPADPATVRRLTLVRDLLRELHRELMQLQRRTHELGHGPVGAQQLLSLLIQAPEFGWLRAVSSLAAEADTLLDRTPRAAAASDFLHRAGRLLDPATASPEFAPRYHEALQQSVEAVGIHSELRQLLRDHCPPMSAN
jgi:hypothetical protein